MKNTILKILTFLLIAVCVFALYSCNDEPEECEAHSYGNPVWEWDENEAKLTLECAICGEKTEPKATLSDSVKIEATCTAKGLKEISATVVYEGEKYIDKKEIELAELPHNVEVIEAVPPSCYDTGLAAGERCSVCSTVLLEQSVVEAAHQLSEDGKCSKCGFDIAETQGLEFIHFSITTSDSEIISGYMVNGIGEVSASDIIIPRVYKSEPVIAIADGAFKNCHFIKDVVLPDSIKSIGTGAFSACTGLISITVPEGVLRIESSAFSGCSSLASITLPFLGPTADSQGMGYLGYIFGASSYEEHGIKVPESLKKITLIGEIETVYSNAFMGCTNITEVVLPDSVQRIAGDVFNGCVNLTSINIPSSLAVVDGSAFASCTAISKIDIGDIAKWCAIQFGNAESNPMNYAKKVYVGNELISELVIPEGVSTIWGYAFIKLPITKLTLPESLEKIYYNAFEGCTQITELTIPDGVVSIGFSAFKDCTALESIELPFIGDEPSTPQYGNLGFIFGSKGTNESVPESLETVSVTKPYSIQSSAFADCSALSEIILPEGLNRVGQKAFMNCSDLSQIVIPTTVTTMGERLFEGCTKLNSISVPFIGSNKTNSATNNLGYFFGQSGSNNTVVPQNLKKVNITNATCISNEAFLNCTGISEISLPETLTGIYWRAFKNCTALTKIIIPDSVEVISKGAFEGCSVLESISIPFVGGDMNYYSSLSDNHFGYIFGADSYADNSAYVPASLKSVTVTNCTKICENTFYGCSAIEKIIVSPQTEIIDFSAFAACVALKEISIPFTGRSATENQNASGLLSHFGYIFGATIAGENSLHVPSSLEKVTITGTAVGYEAFRGCAGIKYIVLDNVSLINDYAFYGCSALESIALPNGLWKIGKESFTGCSSLTSITFDDISTWYRTASSTDWENNENGTETDLGTPSTNAEYFKLTYSDYYWYKK